MPKSKPSIDPCGEVEELSMAQVKRMRLAYAVLPSSFQSKLRTRGLVRSSLRAVMDGLNNKSNTKGPANLADRVKTRL